MCAETQIVVGTVWEVKIRIVRGTVESRVLRVFELGSSEFKQFARSGSKNKFCLFEIKWKLTEKKKR